MKNQKQKSASAFTLAELIIVVIIIGVLAAIGVPNFLLVLEKFRAEEGKQMLFAMYAENKRCQLENPASSWCDWTATDDKVQVRDSKYFPKSRFAFGESWTGYLYLGRVMRMDNNDTVQLYTLRIKPNARIVCWDGSGPPPKTGICAKLGIPYDP